MYFLARDSGVDLTLFHATFLWNFGNFNLVMRRPCGFLDSPWASQDGGRERGVVGVKCGGSKWAFYLSPVPQPPGAEERPPKLKYSGVYTPD